MRMGKKAKILPCGKFVCQHEMARDWKTVIQHVHHILHGGYGGHGEGKLPKFHQNLHLMFRRFFPAILCWPEGENYSFLLLLMMKLRSDTKHNLHSSVQIFFCIFRSSKCEKITPNVKKQNWNNFKFLFSMEFENFFLLMFL